MHYRVNTLDLVMKVLTASEKAYTRLVDSYKTLQTLKSSATSSEDIATLENVIML